MPNTSTLLLNLMIIFTLNIAIQRKLNSETRKVRSPDIFFRIFCVPHDFQEENLKTVCASLEHCPSYIYYLFPPEPTVYFLCCSN